MQSYRKKQALEKQITEAQIQLLSVRALSFTRYVNGHVRWTSKSDDVCYHSQGPRQGQFPQSRAKEQTLIHACFALCCTHVPLMLPCCKIHLSISSVLSRVSADHIPCSVMWISVKHCEFRVGWNGLQLQLNQLQSHVRVLTPKRARFGETLDLADLTPLCLNSNLIMCSHPSTGHLEVRR